MDKVDKYLTNETRGKRNIFIKNAPSDERNPAFLFNSTHTDLLLRIANKKLDPVLLAKQTLAGRGLDKRGKWVGFEEADKIWGI